MTYSCRDTQAPGFWQWMEGSEGTAAKSCDVWL